MGVVFVKIEMYLADVNIFFYLWTFFGKQNM